MKKRRNPPLPGEAGFLWGRNAASALGPELASIFGARGRSGEQEWYERSLAVISRQILECRVWRVTVSS